MDLIKLTGLRSGYQIWYNPSHIISIENWYVFPNEPLEGSEIRLVDGSCRHVKESVDDIVAMISVLKVSSSSLHCLIESEKEKWIEEHKKEKGD